MDLRKWARTEHWSPQTFQEELENLVNLDFLLKVEKIVDSRHAVFYSLNNQFRESYLKKWRDIEEGFKEIDDLDQRPNLLNSKICCIL